MGRDGYKVAVTDQRKAEAMADLRANDNFVLFTVTGDGVSVTSAVDLTPIEYVRLFTSMREVAEQFGRQVIADIDALLDELESSE